MNVTAIALVLVSAFLHALTSFLTKNSIHKQVFLWCYHMLGLVVFFPLFLYFLIADGPSLEASIKWGLITGFVHFLYVYFISKSYEHADLSLVYPIMRSSPALVLICAVLFFREKVSFEGIAGILLVTFGVYIINLETLKVSDLRRPVRNLFSNKGSRFAFLTMLAVTGYTLIDKRAVGQINPIVFSYLVPVFTMAYFTPYLWKTGGFKLLHEEWKRNRRSIFLNSIISQGGYLLILVAFSFEKVSYVAGFRQLSIVFAVLMGGHILKEKHKTVRLIASLIIFLGAFLIAAA